MVYLDDLECVVSCETPHSLVGKKKKKKQSMQEKTRKNVCVETTRQRPRPRHLDLDQEKTNKGFCSLVWKGMETCLVLLCLAVWALALALALALVLETYAADGKATAIVRDKM